MSSLRYGEEKLLGYLVEGLWVAHCIICSVCLFSVKVGFVFEWIKHIDLVLTISESDPE